MTWFAFSGLNGGKAVNLAGSQEKQAAAEGFHGYGTEAQAEAKPNSVNFLTKVLAELWVADYSFAVKEQAQPGGKNATVLNPKDALGATTSYVENSIPGVQQIGSFFSALSQGSTWIRVAEGILGIILIAVGVARITHAVPLATSIGKAVP